MNKKMKNFRRQIIEETDMGIYIWTIDKKPIMDDEGNYLCVPAKKGDVKVISALRNVVYGYLKDMGEEPRGAAVFLASRSGQWMTGQVIVIDGGVTIAA